MAKDNSTGRKIALGALVAGAVGYVAGVLTAPKSGKETRQDIADKASDTKDEIIDQLKALQFELEDLIADAKNKATGMGAKAKAEMNEAVAAAKDAKEKASVLIKSAKAGEADDPELNRAIKQAKAAAKNLAKYLKS